MRTTKTTKQTLHTYSVTKTFRDLTGELVTEGPGTHVLSASQARHAAFTIRQHIDANRRAIGAPPVISLNIKETTGTR